MAGERISIPTADGSFSAYLAEPPSEQAPGIVLIQEIFGVNAAMRELADEFAAAGFVAMVPDLFWRIEPGIQLTDKTEAEWQKAFGYMRRFNPTKGVKDIQAAISHLRTVPGVTGKVGAVGYCLGGFLAYLTATRTDSDASVGYYGMNIQKFLDEAGKIKKPLMLHVAEKDEFNPPESQAEVAAGLAANPQVTIHSYPEMEHAFARPGGAHYDASAAKLANERTIAFFKQHLA